MQNAGVCTSPKEDHTRMEKLSFYEELQEEYDVVKVEIRILMRNFKATVGNDRRGIKTVV